MRSRPLKNRVELLIAILLNGHVELGSDRRLREKIVPGTGAPKRSVTYCFNSPKTIPCMMSLECVSLRSRDE